MSPNTSKAHHIHSKLLSISGSHPHSQLEDVSLLSEQDAHLAWSGQCGKSLTKSIEP
jgi:hypothetical protein